MVFFPFSFFFLRIAYHVALLFSFLTHWVTCFLELWATCFLELCPWCFFVPEFLPLLVLGLFVEPLEFVLELTAISLSCCSFASSVDAVEGNAAGCGRKIPGRNTSCFLISIRPPFSCWSFSIASNFSLLNFSESEERILSSLLTSNLLEVWIQTVSRYQQIFQTTSNVNNKTL